MPIRGLVINCYDEMNVVKGHFPGAISNEIYSERPIMLLMGNQPTRCGVYDLSELLYVQQSLHFQKRREK